MPQRHRPVEHEQPLLVAVLVVVGADCLSRRKLVDAAAKLGSADRRPEARHSGPAALWVRGVELDRLREEVHALHAENLLQVEPFTGERVQAASRSSAATRLRPGTASATRNPTA